MSWHELAKTDADEVDHLKDADHAEAEVEAQQAAGVGHERPDGDLFVSFDLRVEWILDEDLDLSHVGPGIVEQAFVDRIVDALTDGMEIRIAHLIEGVVVDDVTAGQLGILCSEESNSMLVVARADSQNLLEHEAEASHEGKRSFCRKRSGRERKSVGLELASGQAFDGLSWGPVGVEPDVLDAVAHLLVDVPCTAETCSPARLEIKSPTFQDFMFSSRSVCLLTRQQLQGHCQQFFCPKTRQLFIEQM